VSKTIAGVFPIGDGGPATSAMLEVPQAVVADATGTIYIADAGNGAIRKVSKGSISTVAGYTGYIYDLKLDPTGNLFIATGGNVFELTPAGKVSNVAGNGTSGAYTGDGGAAINASFSGIYAIAVDGAGDIFICDANNHAIRKVTPDGIVRTIAGGKGKGFAGDNGPATNALFNYPRHLALDATGNLYINDYNNNRVRKISTDGSITTIAGNNVCCTSTDGGPAVNAFLVNRTGDYGPGGQHLHLRFPDQSHPQSYFRNYSNVCGGWERGIRGRRQFGDAGTFFGSRGPGHGPAE
jgi:hypothetical protein